MQTAKVPKAVKKTQAAYSPGWGKEIITKNLFSPDRGYSPSPPPPSEAKAPGAPLPQPPVPPNLRLSGIILDQYGEHVAFIQIDGDPPKRVREGDAFDGISVEDIDDRNVMLIWNGEEINLSLKQIRTLQRD